MANRGAWAIAIMFGIGLALAGGSVVYHSTQGRKCLEFWGSRDGELIRHAKGVEAWLLADAAEEPKVGDASEVITIDSQRRWIKRRLDLGNARGLVHARHALIMDANYDWSREVKAEDAIPASAWTHAIRFSEGKEEVVLLFDFREHRVRRLDRLPGVSLAPTISAAEQALLEREFGNAKAAALRPAS